MFVSCIVKRISRPPIVGYIYDAETLISIDSVKITTWNNKKEDFEVEAFSNERGAFHLSIKTYRDKTAIGGEAPMEFYNFTLRKNGYEEKKIESRSRYGFSKDTIRYDSILLKRKNIKSE